MTAVKILEQPTSDSQTNLEVESRDRSEANQTSIVAEQPEEVKSPDPAATIDLAAADVRAVLEQQREQGQMLTTKLNILFVVNGALLTSLTLSKLMFLPSVFSFGEILGFLVNFTLLINAFLPRQVAVSPNLSKQFLERYLNLTAEQYQLKMMVNLIETYNTNKQRLDDVSQTLSYAAYVTWTIALMIMLHVVAAYFVPVIQISNFG
ncbi:MAG: hypothetical protein SAJ37_05500 [Oscillatoria sp. PMC 1068.18]|nr:hypothetical protein [Oscillatoria sp. PMC 1076.18]MEC4988185.1 hypothetical protein [Oscillatoria sp. PMC 1068.18]